MSSVYKIDVAERDGGKALTFSGDLVINHIDKMVPEVRAALDPITDVSVEVQNPDNIDMTFIQLLVAIRRACTEAGKKFQVKSNLKDDLKVLIHKAGLTKEFGI